MTERKKIAFQDITKERLQEESDDEILSIHLRSHQLAGKICEFVKEYHDSFIVSEMIERGFDHKSEIECSDDIKSRGLYLVEPHGELIANGRKKAIATGKDYGLSGQYILVSGGRAFGMVHIDNAQQLSTKEFDERFNDHLVSEHDRIKWWHDKNELYLYNIKQFEEFDELIEVDVEPGTQLVMNEIKFKSRADEVLNKLEGLPDKFVWIPGFVTLTGSTIYARDREPRDVDIVLRAKSEEGKFNIDVDAAFGLKLERVIEEVLGKGVQYIANAYGANWKNIELYDLCLVRKKNLEYLEPNEEEFAEMLYKARTISMSAVDRLLKVGSDKIKSDAKRSFDEDKVIPGRAFIPLKPMRPAPEEERQTIDKFYKYIEDNDILPAFVSAKRDGVRHTIHKHGDKILILSDDGEDNTDKMPRLVKRLNELSGNDFVIDTEIEYWNDGQHYPREAAAGAVKKSDDNNLVANIFRIIYWNGKDLHNEPFETVYEAMKDIPTDTKTDGILHPEKGQLNLVPHFKVENLSELENAVDRIAYKPGVEGVVVKRANGTYPLDGNPGTHPTSIKWHKNVPMTVTALDKVETKTPGVYNYVYGVPIE